MAALDRRVEAIERGLKELQAPLEALESEVARLRMPPWKRSPRTFWGAAFGILLLFGMWILPRLWGGLDPMFPRFVHQNLLLTDRAVGSVLTLAGAGEEAAKWVDTTLYKGLTRLVSQHIREGQTYTYHGAKWFRAQVLPTLPLSCYAALDPRLRRHFEAIYDEDTMNGWCADPEAPRLFIGTLDIDPLRIPFQAKKGDTVTLRVEVSAADTADGDLHPSPHKLIDAFFDKDRTPQKLPAPTVMPGISELTIPVDGAERARIVSLELSEEGVKSVELPQSDGREGELGRRKSYAIAVSTIVTVERNKLKEK